MSFIRIVINSVTDGVSRLCSAAGRIGETFSTPEFMQQYGFASRPKSGATGYVLVKNGQVIVVASDDSRYRIALEAGEVALYTDEGDKLHFKRGRKLEITAGTSLTINTPSATINGDLTVTGNVSDGTGSLAAMRITYNAHSHTDSVSGQTTPPMVQML